MRFSTMTVSVLAAGLAVASPNSIAKRENQEMTNVIAFAAQQADCSLFDCAAVVAAGACIAGAIAVPGAVPAVLACVGGGAPSICPCAGCIDALNNFLVENNVCPE
ncbi:hypothetical protein GT037_000872 [Alternaria burnsii]|uniref:Fungal calcium binding protein domain-containing protein n=1 Tax=Alternaria burnsii TaxID=1187904 RepID=A0A8H7BF04_9PLEO|nr:uncharacterized protein GT037_000872 [Alternaria burnsii]KAF7681896.1 hypothetical protein GT037_000872 [Alternaria burnsii]CAI9635801.1 unnamed protein product [Alternaria burnsii]